MNISKTTTPTGILCINLGTPESPTLPAVRHYLKEFLLDPYVITLPTPLRYLLVRGLILPFRSKRSTHAYQQIWTTQGSPLLVNSMALQQALSEKIDDNYRVAFGMRYGNPSIASALCELQLQGCTQLIVLPLFPQFSEATNQSAIDKTHIELKKLNYHPDVKIIRDFHDHPDFINAMARQINKTLTAVSPDFILFSYHGLPERQLKNTKKPDYREQCYRTTHLIANILSLPDTQYTTSFQSRLGKAKWIQPYTNQMIISLREKGIKRLGVVCPSFVADCLETLEEIDIRLRKQWLALGGESFYLVPCLNAEKAWVDGLISMLTNASTPSSPAPP